MFFARSARARFHLAWFAGHTGMVAWPQQSAVIQRRRDLVHCAACWVSLPRARGGGCGKDLLYAWHQRRMDVDHPTGPSIR